MSKGINALAAEEGKSIGVIILDKALYSIHKLNYKQTFLHKLSRKSLTYPEEKYGKISSSELLLGLPGRPSEDFGLACKW